MSRRKGAPYTDQIEADGLTLVYEGHDLARSAATLNPKLYDQPSRNPGGTLTQNGLFAEAVARFKNGAKPELVQVYEKLHDGIWVFNGLFQLLDYWIQKGDERNVFKFRLKLIHSEGPRPNVAACPEDDDRIIPSSVKLEVWKRDEGKCRKCGAKTGLHFDHIIPYSKGGSSKDAQNIQILCGRHNLEKRDRIE